MNTQNQNLVENTKCIQIMWSYNENIDFEISILPVYMDFSRLRLAAKTCGEYGRVNYGPPYSW